MRTSWENEPETWVGRAPAPVGRSPSRELTKQIRSLGVALSVEILGGLLGTVVSLAFADSPLARTVGAFVGITVTGLVTVTGPFLHGRVTAAFGVTLLALALTYTGGQAAEAAGPPGTDIYGPAKTPVTKPSTAPTSSGPVVSKAPGRTCEGRLCIQVAPQALTCLTSTCEPIVVSNPGRQVLKVGRIELTGPAAGDFKSENDCVGVHLSPGRACTIAVSYAGASEGKATLLIHQNLDGAATEVPLIGRPGSVVTETPLPDLALSASRLSCAVTREGSLSGNDALTVFLSVRDVGAVPVEHLVPFDIVADTGAQGRGNTGISTGNAVTGMSVDLRAGDYGHPHTLVASVDPDNRIAEADEQNNRLSVVVSLRSRPTTSTDLPCHLLG